MSDLYINSIFCLYIGLTLNNGSFTVFLLDILVLIVWIICSSVVAMISQVVVLNIKKATNKTVDAIFTFLMIAIIYIFGIMSGLMFFR